MDRNGPTRDIEQKGSDHLPVSTENRPGIAITALWWPGNSEIAQLVCQASRRGRLCMAGLQLRCPTNEWLKAWTSEMGQIRTHAPQIASDYLDIAR